MEAIQSMRDKMQAYYDDLAKRVKRQLFGNNNERLDFLIDSFYKLDPKQKNLAIIGSIGAAVLVIIAVIAIYLTSINNLKSDLNKSMIAFRQLDLKLDEYNQQKEVFEGLEGKISAKVNGVRIKPFFETLTKKHAIEMESPNEKRNPLSADNALGKKFDEVRADLRINKISLPKLIKFLVAIESSGNFIKVSELTIQGRHEDRLYFDSQIRVSGFTSK